MLLFLNSVKLSSVYKLACAHQEIEYAHGLVG